MAPSPLLALIDDGFPSLAGSSGNTMDLSLRSSVAFADGAVRSFAAVVCAGAPQSPLDSDHLKPLIVRVLWFLCLLLRSA